MIGGRDPR
jgi:hypothetical protein